MPQRISHEIAVNNPANFGKVSHFVFKLQDLFKAFRETFSELTSEVGTAVGSAFGQLEAKVNTLRPLEMLEDALTPRTASRSQEKTSPVLRSPPPATTRKSSLSKSRAAASALPLEDWRWDDATENQETSNIMRSGISGRPFRAMQVVDERSRPHITPNNTYYTTQTLTKNFEHPLLLTPALIPARFSSIQVAK